MLRTVSRIALRVVQTHSDIFARIAALLLTAHTAQTAASRLDRKRKYARSVILFTSPLLALTAGIQKLGSRLSNRQSFMNVCM